MLSRCSHINTWVYLTSSPFSSVSNCGDLMESPESFSKGGSRRNAQICKIFYRESVWRFE